MLSVAPALDVPRPDHAHDWALVDVETSGLVPRRDRILSVAVLTFGPDGTQTGEFSTLVNPGCDPGPVHVHGLTPERLAGAPTFDQVAERVGALLRDRVLVAHNAQFDYDFLAHEFARARLHLPVTQRLCTLALNRRVEPPTDDLSLASLAAHYGVPQTRAHDALDDTRVLAGIFRASLTEAARLDLPLPLVPCPPRQDPQFAPNPPKTPCAFRNPGRLEPGGPLVQGMKIAITGETTTTRAELVGRSVGAGLNMMASVSRHTSVLVTNEAASASAKARRAAAEGVPVLDEDTFLRLLEDVRPGTPHVKQSPAPTAPPATAPAEVPAPEPLPVPARTEPATAAVTTPPSAPTHPAVAAPRRRRVLVLGGTHEAASAARVRIVERGWAAALNLSASVTDVVLLPGGETDRRMARVTALELPVHAPDWLGAPPAPETVAAPARTDTAGAVLPRGGVVDLPTLPSNGRWHLGASWARQSDCEIDVVAFVLDEDEQVSCDGDFVFYGAPESPDGAVRLLCDGPTEQSVTVDPTVLPPAVRRVAIAAAIDGAAVFGDIGAVQITLAPGSDAPVTAQATLDAATSERTLLLAELYRRGPLWRFRAVGQGYDQGLEGLVRGYGVEVK
ncbi:DEDDh family exonuclease [Streptomyces hydrogenans]|uniref:DEDDh family exonuclease n=1 Tax=Streptomyces hydrogenans TaxID=1873719 RepID=UPI00278BFEBA|nr:DEDDh family exonuclease [Streptomyces hydrogenans]